MQQYSAQQFREKLAGVSDPRILASNDNETMKSTGVALVMALRDVFGSSLDRKTLWERISNGMAIAARKSGGRTDRFIAALLEYVRAEANTVVGSEKLKAIVDSLLAYGENDQRAFVNTCAQYRMLLCLQAREDAQEEKRLKEQLGAEKVQVNPDGSIMARERSKS
jgi:hypothetical protein